MCAALQLNTCSTVSWRRLREQLMNSFTHALKEDMLDYDIVDMLTAINSVPCIATSSSCSGRIAVFSAPSPGDKRQGGIVYKWHRPVDPAELREAILDARNTGHRYVWASAQPPILALHTCSLKLADMIADIAINSGYKYTGYKYTSRSYYMFIIGSERIDIPLVFEGRAIVDLDYNLLANLLNSYLLLGKRKLNRLRRAFSSTLDLLRKGCEEATLV